MSAYSTIPTVQPIVPDTAALRAELEATRTAYQQLLASLSDADLARPCAISKWTIKEVMCHLVLSLEQASPTMVARARQSKGMPKFLDTRFGHWLNYKMAVWAARKCDRATLAKRYDKACEKLLQLMNTVGADEWQLPTAYPDGQPLNMTTVFQVPGEHLALHAGWIRQTLRR